MPCTILKNSFTDYTKTIKSFEINKSAIKRGDKVLLVDEWIETGSQMKSAIGLIEKLGGKVIGITTIYAERNQQTNILFDKYNLKAINIHDKNLY
ncbi:MAG: phosphoribosyltransferase family protein [bacterium]